MMNEPSETNTSNTESEVHCYRRLVVVDVKTAIGKRTTASKGTTAAEEN
jgi:hypothetical protein